MSDDVWFIATLIIPNKFWLNDTFDSFTLQPLRLMLVSHLCIKTMETKICSLMISLSGLGSWDMFILIILATLQKKI